MAGGMVMRGGVAVGRVVATPHMAATAAQAQMHPFAVDGQTFFATTRTGRDRMDLIGMAAALAHALVDSWVALASSETGTGLA
ncbi:conserved hypothetical protein [Xanthomonas citri pv. citri]|nr:conserved hypothetical protein [Xanthomonas citri pv. citri]CEL50715.1 conserved hypothetical protein [Xanthomonas citri pv. citri]